MAVQTSTRLIEPDLVQQEEIPLANAGRGTPSTEAKAILSPPLFFRGNLFRSPKS